MKVVIKADNVRLRFYVPLSALRLAGAVPKRYMPDVGFDAGKTARELYCALKRAKKDFRGLEIVHVLSADGEEVIITL